MSINKICDLLFNCLSTLKQDFDREEYLKKFHSLRTNLDRVNFVYKDMSKHSLFFDFIRDEKNDTKAINLKEHGNKMFALGKFEEALKSYTNSIKMAKTKETLAIAYANRSASLFKLQLYEECIVDIARALSNNYPSEKKCKLIARLTQATKYKKQTQTSHEETPSVSRGQKNAKIDCAKNCIKIMKNEEFGRLIVATRDIEIGEIMCVEKPYVCVLEESNLFHCHECIELCYNPIPCRNCTQRYYCSEDCREKAWNNYHKYECSILRTMIEYGMTQSLLPLKIALLAVEKYNQLKTITFDQNANYHSDRYDEVHYLQASTEHRSINELLSFSLIAASTFQLLQRHTSFFKDFNTPNVKDNFKEVLLLQLQICQNNTISINEYVTDVKNYRSSELGRGLYPFMSLFNHSCSHNVVRFFYGSTVVMRAYNTIKKGDQCFITYGAQYEYDHRVSRQMMLKLSYFFDCKCRPCRENWVPNIFHFPLFLDLGMNSEFEVNCVEALLRSGDVKMATAILPRLIFALKECQSFEPMGNAWDIKQLIYICYSIQGNRRALL